MRFIGPPQSNKARSSSKFSHINSLRDPFMSAGTACMDRHQAPVPCATLRPHRASLSPPTNGCPLRSLSTPLVVNAPQRFRTVHPYERALYTQYGTVPRWDARCAHALKWAMPVARVQTPRYWRTAADVWGTARRERQGRRGVS